MCFHGRRLTLLTENPPLIAELVTETIGKNRYQMVKRLEAIKESVFSGSAVWEPSSKRHVSLDLLMEPNKAIQVTLAKSHDPLKWARFRNNLRVLFPFPWLALDSASMHQDLTGRMSFFQLMCLLQSSHDLRLGKTSNFLGGCHYWHLGW